MRALYRITSTTITLILGVIVVLGASFLIAIAAGMRPLIVTSGSMEPTVSTGALAFARVVDGSEVKKGDVITFPHPQRPGELVTHRVVQVVEREGKLPAYITKGDANAQRDPWAIELNGNVGRLAFSIPFAGYAAYYATNGQVKLFTIGALCLLMIVLLLGRIWGFDGSRREPAGAGS